MEEIDIEICQTKKTQRLKEHQKHYRDLKKIREKVLI